MINDYIKIGTRGSRLALWQAEFIKTELENRYKNLKIEIVKIKTKGDKILDAPLARFGGKGLFVKEIEDALLQSKIDLAVHSIKDMPVDLPSGLHIVSITEREDPRDVLISKNNQYLNDLPKKSKIGTSSLRRKSQLLHIRSDLIIRELRGNLDTRIRKLREDDLDAIIVASAGLKRMKWDKVITQYLSPDNFIPAIGQGSLGIECRIDDSKMNSILKFLNHDPSMIAVNTERTFLKRLGGGCQVPIGAYCIVDGGSINLKGFVSSIDGQNFIVNEINGNKNESERIGIALAENLLKKGADKILEELKSL